MFFLFTFARQQFENIFVRPYRRLFYGFAAEKIIGRKGGEKWLIVSTINFEKRRRAKLIVTNWLSVIKKKQFYRPAYIEQQFNNSVCNEQIRVGYTNRKLFTLSVRMCTYIEQCTRHSELRVACSNVNKAHAVCGCVCVCLQCANYIYACENKINK